MKRIECSKDPNRVTGWRIKRREYDTGSRRFYGAVAVIEVGYNIEWTAWQWDDDDFEWASAPSIAEAKEQLAAQLGGGWHWSDEEDWEGEAPHE